MRQVLPLQNVIDRYGRYIQQLRLFDLVGLQRIARSSEHSRTSRKNNQVPCVQSETTPISSCFMPSSSSSFLHSARRSNLIIQGPAWTSANIPAKIATRYVTA